MTTYDIAGRSVTMPVVVRDAAAGTAMFEVDRARAQALVPGDAFRVVESTPGRAQLNLATIDYRDNDLGDYLEVGLTVFVVPAAGGNDGGEAEAGTFITHLPVDQEFTCAAGRGIWGFPKTVEDITTTYTDDTVTTTLQMDGQLVLRLMLPRGGNDEMPQLAMTTYTYRDGVPCATAFRQGGSGSQVRVGDDGVVLELGSHPLADALRDLGLPAAALLSTWTEHMTGSFAAPVELVVGPRTSSAGRSGPR